MLQMTAREEEAITRFQFGENWTRFLSVVIWWLDRAGEALTLLHSRR